MRGRADTRVIDDLCAFLTGYGERQLRDIGRRLGPMTLLIGLVPRTVGTHHKGLAHQRTPDPGR
jgi:hypothetical protein